MEGIDLLINELEFTVSSRPVTFSVMWKSLYLFTLLLFTVKEQWAGNKKRKFFIEEYLFSISKEKQIF